jgi:hypothetical protein
VSSTTCMYCKTVYFGASVENKPKLLSHMTGCSFDAGKKVFYGQVSAATTAQGAGCYEVRDLELLTAHVKTIIQSHRRSQCCTLAVHQKMLDWSAARLDDAVKRAERERAAQQKYPFNMAVSGGGSKRSSDAANSALCKKPKGQRGIFRLCRGRPELRNHVAFGRSQPGTQSHSELRILRQCSQVRQTSGCQFSTGKAPCIFNTERETRQVVVKGRG